VRLRDHLDPLLEAHREETDEELPQILGEASEDDEQGGLVCSVCEDVVPFDDLRAHLAGHNPGAWAFDTEEVWACFMVRR
jgi:hypothetical protein